MNPPRNWSTREEGRAKRIKRVAGGGREGRSRSERFLTRGVARAPASMVSDNAGTPANLCQFQWGGVGSDLTLRTTILHNDRAGRKRYLS